jgi:glycosyltransferase involved in cell wall biosynthesis
MRIALTTNLFSPIQTGTAHYTRELAQNLVQAGHHVIVITCNLDATFHEEILDGYRVFKLPSFHLPVSKITFGFEQFYLGYIPGNSRRIEEILNQEQIELVHQCGHLLDLNYLIPRVCKRLKISAVCSIHTIIHYPGNKLIDKLMKLIDKTFVNWFSISHYKTLIALDAEVARYADERYQHSDVRIVPLCLDSTILEYPSANLVDEAPIFKILSVGHVTSMRHRLDLIRSVGYLREEGIAAELTIVGKILELAPVKLAQEMGLDEVVHFVGEMPRAQIMEYAREFHVEAHWITIPALGTAILEAMALGLPAVTFGYPGIQGDAPLEDGENIIFIKPGDIEYIAGRLAPLALSPSLRVSIGEKGQALVRDYLTWANVINHFEIIYSELIASQK